MADDTLGPRVRNSAVQLAVAVYQTFGMEAVMPLLAGLRPAKQALLKQKFQESEEDGGIGHDGEEDDGEGGEEVRNVDLSGLVVQGCGVRTPSWFQQQMQLQIIPELPGTVGDEEVMMDCILEEAGAVFSGAGIIQEEEPASPQFRGTCSQDEVQIDDEFQVQMDDGFQELQEPLFNSDVARNPRLRDELGHLEDVHRVLEQELLNLGIDIENIEDQRAIVNMLQAEQEQVEALAMRYPGGEDPSVEALLCSLVQQDSHGDVSVEVF
jgi:hypothetical protein